MQKNLESWKIRSVESLLDTKYLRVDKETCELPNGNVIPDFYTLWQPDWVLILAQNAEGLWLMEKQYRHGSRTISLEFPAGIIEAGESPVAAAKRELQEECAFGGGAFDLVQARTRKARMGACRRRLADLPLFYRELFPLRGSWLLCWLRSGFHSGKAGLPLHPRCQPHLLSDLHHRLLPTHQ